MLAACDPSYSRPRRNSDVGREPILKATSDVSKAAIVIYVRRRIVELLI